MRPTPTQQGYERGKYLLIRHAYHEQYMGLPAVRQTWR